MKCFSVFIILIFGGLSNADYAAEEDRLIALLRSNGSVDARPEKSTQVTASVVLFALNNVNIGSERMSLSGILYCTWTDKRLAWDPTQNDIYKVVIKTNHVWVPPLVIENEIEKVEVLGKDKTPLRVFHDGKVIWNPPISTTTSCSADITYYPYDKQTCFITVVGWSYTLEEVNLVTVPDNPVDQTYYVENGEWYLLSTGYKLENISDGTDIFRKLVFSLTFRRKWPYYGQNTIVPIVLNSLLMGMAFVVPIESGEKMSYCLTVFLSFIVLLTMVSEDLPSISNETSMLQSYLSIVLCIGTLSTICTTAVLRLYHKDERKPVPGWLQKLTRHVFAPLSCQTCKSNKVVSPDGNEFSTTEKSGLSEERYSWKEIAVILDKCFFVTFAGALLALTLSVMVALYVNYNS